MNDETMVECRNCGKEIEYRPGPRGQLGQWWHKDGLGYKHPCLPKITPDMLGDPPNEVSISYIGKKDKYDQDPACTNATRAQAEIILLVCYPQIVVDGLSDVQAIEAARLIAAAVDRARGAL